MYSKIWLKYPEVFLTSMNCYQYFLFRRRLYTSKKFYVFFIRFRYLQADLDTYELTELNYQFDVILIDPPLEEYQRRCPGLMFKWRPWQWEEIIRLEIGQVAAQRAFCFLWCGSAEGLDEGRKCLKAWGECVSCSEICSWLYEFLTFCAYILT